MYASLNFVKLIYPPISNQFAEWLSEVPEVREYVKKSKLYMLAQRHEVLFENYGINTSDRIFYFDLVCGSVEARNLAIQTDELIGDFEGEVEIELGERHIRIWDAVEKNSEPIYWATTDKLIYDCWRKRISIQNLTNIQEFTTFDLYYVGISKENDSFSRLFDSGHKNRLKILTNETQYTPTARLTDEIYIFLFDIEDLGVKQLSVDDLDIPDPLDKKKLVADAEKAFINILDCKYNEVKYENYPAGADGLSDAGLTRYGYFIDEDITFIAPKGKIRGVHDIFQQNNRQPDLIFIEGDSVEVVTSETFEAAANNHA
ncbi:hypothetical protein [Mariprofundus ferrooxydans]|uniref:hypothetical protein n=1 Tax=Mariprofundus ferrooxydans TaxID=314344 RepID=UPI00142FF2C9|nr:hypothetical protein [Mariprofundus ferrooxydans]